jgi:hypothetical protein
MVDLGPVLESPVVAGAGRRAPGLAGPLLAALLAVLALAPLAPRVPSGDALAAAAVALLALAAGMLALAGLLPLPVSLRRVGPAILGFAVLASVAAAQALLPLPPGWAPLFDEARAALPASGVVPLLSFDPEATLSALMRLGAAGGAFFLALQLGRAGARARAGLAALLALAAIEAAAFLAGLHPAPSLAGIGLVLALALMFDRMADGPESGRGLGPALSNFLQRLTAHGLPALGAMLLLGTALVVAGAPSFAAAAAALTVLLGVAAAPSLAVPRRRGLGALWLLLAGAGAGLALWSLGAGADPGAASARHAALFAVLDHPLGGVGLGATEPALRLYREAHLAAPGPLPAPLALALGAGLPAAAALGLACAFLAGLAVLGLWRRRRNAAFPAAALGATVTVALSAPPSLAALLAWAAVLGIGAAHSFRTRGG